MLIGIAFEVDSVNAPIREEHLLTKISCHFDAGSQFTQIFVSSDQLEIEALCLKITGKRLVIYFEIHLSISESREPLTWICLVPFPRPLPVKARWSRRSATAGRSTLNMFLPSWLI